MPAMQQPSAGTPPPSTDPNKVVLTIGDRKVTAAEYAALVKALPQQYQEIAMGAGRRQFAQNLIEMSILAGEAQKRNMDKDPAVAAQLTFSHDNALAGAMFQNLQESASITDADILAYYNAHKSDYESIKARHILIRVQGAPMPAPAGKPELTDDQAKAKAEDIRKRIIGGEDFAKIAKDESDDTGSADEGGALPEFHKGEMVPPFEEAAYALKPGDISEPVRSPFGYHIIQVQEHNTKTLEEAKPQIVAALRPNAARKAIDALVAKTKVEMDDSYFGPDPAAPPAVTPQITPGDK